MAQTRVPEDHKTKAPTAAERRESDAEQDELLAGMPALRPPHRLRARQRSRIMRIALKFMPFMPDDDSGFDIDVKDPRMADLLDIFSDVDDFAESIAEDPAAYVEWAEGASYDQLSALLSRYSSAVGE
ncbi:hypothetical protein [Rathayibacter sp. Leaf248]|uniref:hypothetical protein n=1 Tax=Rathayibacter sp. Leaf248 TaxID=2876555 RepID=UPI001E5399CA|nr:hypothetical protein [Rathayibacter sp. Leaf248]